MRQRFAELFFCGNYAITLWFLFNQYSQNYMDWYFWGNLSFFTALNAGILVYLNRHRNQKKGNLSIKVKSFIKENYRFSRFFGKVTTVASGTMLYIAVVTSFIPAISGASEFAFGLGNEELSERLNFLVKKNNDESVITSKFKLESFSENEKQISDRNGIIARVYGKNSNRMAHRYVQLGQVYFEKGDYTLARKHFTDGLKRYRSHSDNLGRLEGYTGLALVDSRMNLYESFGHQMIAAELVDLSFYEDNFRRTNRAVENLKTVVYPGTPQQQTLSWAVKNRHNVADGPFDYWGDFSALTIICVPILFANAMFERVMLNGLARKLQWKLLQLENWQDQSELLPKLIDVQIYRKDFAEADKHSRRLAYILE
ncbi:MAG: tetratricopeptide repeat protein [Candidatus Obscuribacterales bacterium]|nr:tetratricopeptide repeat protein [Candidatus Obscuribacterales bacterium]